MYVYIIIIIVFSLCFEQLIDGYSEYRFRISVTDCSSSNYNVPTVINNQFNWNMSHSEWFQDQEWYSLTHSRVLDNWSKRRISHGFCLSGAPITHDDDNQYGNGRISRRDHTFCMTPDNLKELDNILVLDNSKYFEVLYSSIERVNYLGFVDWITSFIAFLGFFPLLLINILIESIVSLSFVDIASVKASETKYWSMLWPGCNGIKYSNRQHYQNYHIILLLLLLVKSYPEQTNLTIHNMIISKIFFTSLVIGSICIAFLFLCLLSLKLSFPDQLTFASKGNIDQHHISTNVEDIEDIEDIEMPRFDRIGISNIDPDIDHDNDVI